MCTRRTRGGLPGLHVICHHQKNVTVGANAMAHYPDVIPTARRQSTYDVHHPQGSNRDIAVSIANAPPKRVASIGEFARIRRMLHQRFALRPASRTFGQGRLKFINECRSWVQRKIIPEDRWLDLAF